MNIHSSVDLGRDGSWRCSMVYNKPKKTGRKMIPLLLLAPRANQSWTRRLEVSAGKRSKPRMCVPSVRRSCWRENSTCLSAGAVVALTSTSVRQGQCPLCREDFHCLKLLQEQVKNAAKLLTAAEREKPDRHLGLFCHSCPACPVTG